MYNRKETIAAICTPPGEGGVAIIRISGPEAVAVADRVFSGSVQDFPSHTVHYGEVRDERMIDHALVIPMLGGASYTGDECVEIHCHGGALVSRRVLDTVLKAGARAALPGEFTFRAFMNGKLDLAQAEAVQEVIAAKSDFAVDAATDQLQGRLSRKILEFQKALTDIAAILEAWVDFPEEGLEFTTLSELKGQLAAIVQEMEKLLATFHDGRLISEGISVCLIGRPNVGKSSLMNALLGKERAIVTHIPGTTRDLLEDGLQLRGLHLRLIDTAGIRETEEFVEKEGIRRSQAAMEKADLVLLILDATESSQDIPNLPKEKTLVVHNKIDLVDTPPEGIAVSAKEKIGLDLLEEAIDRLIWKNGPPARDQTVITSMRHKEALAQAIDGCQQTIEGLDNAISPEFLCLDLRGALQALGRIIGTDITDDILSAIFSRFCLGK